MCGFIGIFDLEGITNTDKKEENKKVNENNTSLTDEI